MLFIGLLLSKFTFYFFFSLLLHWFTFKFLSGRHSDLMLNALNSGSGDPGIGFEPRPGHCVVFLGKTLYSQSPSLRPAV